MEWRERSIRQMQAETEDGYTIFISEKKEGFTWRVWKTGVTAFNDQGIEGTLEEAKAAGLAAVEESRAKHKPPTFDEVFGKLCDIQRQISDQLDALEHAIQYERQRAYNRGLAAANTQTESK